MKDNEKETEVNQLNEKNKETGNKTELEDIEEESSSKAKA